MKLSHVLSFVSFVHNLKFTWWFVDQFLSVPTEDLMVCLYYLSHKSVRTLSGIHSENHGQKIKCKKVEGWATISSCMYLPIIAKIKLLIKWLHGNRVALIVNAWEHIMLP